MCMIVEFPLKSSSLAFLSRLFLKTEALDFSPCSHFLLSSSLLHHSKQHTNLHNLYILENNVAFCFEIRNHYFNTLLYFLKMASSNLYSQLIVFLFDHLILNFTNFVIVLLTFIILLICGRYLRFCSISSVSYEIFVFPLNSSNKDSTLRSPTTFVKIAFRHACRYLCSPQSRLLRSRFLHRFSSTSLNVVR